MEPSGSERALESVRNGRIRRKACLHTHPRPAEPRIPSWRAAAAEDVMDDTLAVGEDMREA
jgi:hypothetical protein